MNKSFDPVITAYVIPFVTNIFLRTLGLLPAQEADAVNRHKVNWKRLIHVQMEHLHYGKINI